MAVSFKKPPLHEVAVGVTFLPRPDLLIPHIGRFWAEIEQSYPVCQHAGPIVDGPDVGAFVDLPLPRVWFLSKDGGSLVQLQQDRLIFNWRATSESAKYIRFPAILAEFQRVRDLFFDYVERLTGQPLVSVGFNLTYVNVIKQDDGWTNFENVEKVFPDLGWRSTERFLPHPVEVSWKSKFELPDGLGFLTADIQPVRLVKNAEMAAKLEITAVSGSLGGRDLAFGRWIEVAHEWVVHAFRDLTGGEMHSKFWLEEV